MARQRRLLGVEVVAREFEGHQGIGADLVGVGVLIGPEQSTNRLETEPFTDCLGRPTTRLVVGVVIVSPRSDHQLRSDFEYEVLDRRLDRRFVGDQPSVGEAESTDAVAGHAEVLERFVLFVPARAHQIRPVGTRIDRAAIGDRGDDDFDPASTQAGDQSSRTEHLVVGMRNHDERGNGRRPPPWRRGPRRCPSRGQGTGSRSNTVRCRSSPLLGSCPGVAAGGCGLDIIHHCHASSLPIARRSQSPRTGEVSSPTLSGVCAGANAGTEPSPIVIALGEPERARAKEPGIATTHDIVSIQYDALRYPDDAHRDVLQQHDADT